MHILLKTRSGLGKIYKTPFQARLDKNLLEDSRFVWQTGTPFGNDYFSTANESQV
jgi:predicted membrane-bound spermidine synthase